MKITTILICNFTNSIWNWCFPKIHQYWGCYQK